MGHKSYHECFTTLLQYRSMAHATIPAKKVTNFVLSVIPDCTSIAKEQIANTIEMTVAEIQSRNQYNVQISKMSISTGPGRATLSQGSNSKWASGPDDAMPIRIHVVHRNFLLPEEVFAGVANCSDGRGVFEEDEGIGLLVYSS